MPEIRVSPHKKTVKKPPPPIAAKQPTPSTSPATAFNILATAPIDTIRPADIKVLQRTAGNRAVSRLLSARRSTKPKPPARLATLQPQRLNTSSLIQRDLNEDMEAAEAQQEQRENITYFKVLDQTTLTKNPDVEETGTLNVYKNEVLKVRWKDSSRRGKASVLMINQKNVADQNFEYDDSSSTIPLSIRTPTTKTDLKKHLERERATRYLAVTEDTKIFDKDYVDKKTVKKKDVLKCAATSVDIPHPLSSGGTVMSPMVSVFEVNKNIETESYLQQVDLDHTKPVDDQDAEAAHFGSEIESKTGSSPTKAMLEETYKTAARTQQKQADRGQAVEEMKKVIDAAPSVGEIDSQKNQTKQTLDTLKTEKFQSIKDRAANIKNQAADAGQAETINNETVTSLDTSMQEIKKEEMGILVGFTKQVEIEAESMKPMETENDVGLKMWAQTVSIADWGYDEQQSEKKEITEHQNRLKQQIATSNSMNKKDAAWEALNQSANAWGIVQASVAALGVAAIALTTAFTGGALALISIGIVLWDWIKSTKARKIIGKVQERLRKIGQSANGIDIDAILRGMTEQTRLDKIGSGATILTGVLAGAAVAATLLAAATPVGIALACVIAVIGLAVLGRAIWKYFRADANAAEKLVTDSERTGDAGIPAKKILEKMGVGFHHPHKNKVQMVKQAIPNFKQETAQKMVAMVQQREGRPSDIIRAREAIRVMKLDPDAVANANPANTGKYTGQIAKKISL